MLQLITAINAENNGHTVSVTCFNYETGSGGVDSLYNVSDTVTVECTYDDEGYINTVTIY